VIRRTDSASSGRLGPFRHPAYAAYWAGISVSNVGSWLQTVAGSIFVYQLTSSAFAVGVFNFAGFLPILLFSVWGGQISDRFDRRQVVQATHLLSMLIAAILATLTIAGAANVVILMVAVFLLNVLWAFGKPALTSLVPNLVPVEEVQDAVGLTSLSFIAGQIVGPVLAAGIMATAGAGLAFLINALTYGGPVLAMVYIGRIGKGGRMEPAGRTRAAMAPVESAAAFMRGHGWVAALLVGIVVTAAAMDAQRTLAPPIVTDRFGLPASTAGLLVGAQSLGSALPLLFFVQLRKRGWSQRAALAGYLFQMAGLILTAVAASLYVAMLGVALIGFGFSLTFPILTAALQVATPDKLRGRVMSIHQMAHLGSRPMTALAAGAIAGLLGTQLGVLSWVALAPVGIVAARAAWRGLAAATTGESTTIDEDPDVAFTPGPGA
jgi:MFS family permease